MQKVLAKKNLSLLESTHQSSRSCYNPQNEKLKKIMKPNFLKNFEL
jgi:hypothetical protein